MTCDSIYTVKIKLEKSLNCRSCPGKEKIPTSEYTKQLQKTKPKYFFPSKKLICYQL